MPGARYKRSRDGSVIHRADCARAGAGAVTWRYADDFDSDGICLAMVNARWLRACRVCKPDAAPSSAGRLLAGEDKP